MGGVGEREEVVVVSRLRARAMLGCRLGVEAEATLAMVGGWRGGGRAVAGPGEVATRARRAAAVQGWGLVVLVAVMLRMLRRVVAEWSRRQSAVWVDIWCQAGTGGPGSTGWWQAVPVEPNVVVNVKVVRLQVVTGAIDKWVWVR